MASSPEPVDPQVPRVRLRSEEWRLAGTAGFVLGLVVALVAASRWPDDRSFVHVFFAVVGLAIAVTGLLLAMSGVELRPDRVVVVNGLRHHVVATHDVDAVTIVGIGDHRGDREPGQPPPRATWVVELETADGPILAFGLMANRKPANRERLLVVTQSIARHCGLVAGPP